MTIRNSRDNIQVKWIESNYVPALPVTQVYGYCFDEDGKILLIKDQNIFTLPGGTPEHGESIENTLQLLSPFDKA